MPAATFSKAKNKEGGTTLVDLCEPIFVYICQLNHAARGGALLEIALVRQEIEDILQEMRARANSDGSLAALYDDMELVILFFVDYLIAADDSPFSFREDWNDNRLAYEKREQTGDKKFFEELDRALADKADRSTQKIAVFYTCLGLGMAGKYQGQPDYLKRKSAECGARLRGQMERGLNAKICPDAYYANTDNLVVKPGRSLVGLTIGLVGMMFVLLIAYYAFFVVSSNELTRHLHQIYDHVTAVIQG